MLVQHLAWMGDAARGDFGRSYTQSPVENLKHLIWPALCEAHYISAPITRLRA